MTRTVQDLIAEAKAEIEEIDPKTARKRLAEGAVAVDVREADELERGHLPGAVHIPRGLLEMKIGQREDTADPQTPIIAYCGGGGRGALATRTLKELGYVNVASLAGGLNAWVEAGHEVQLPAASGYSEDE